MSERIDHIKNARFYIGKATGAVTLAINLPQVTAAIAQAEATLALVEQQRIANVIAWTTANGTEPVKLVADDIAAALGITTEEQK